MKTFVKSPIGLFILFLGSILLPSCQEGCIDPSACNYNPNAIEDDGSCIHNCSYDSEYVPDNSTCTNGDNIFHEIQGQISLQVLNEVDGSPHFGEPILAVNVRKEKYKHCSNNTYQCNGIANDIIGIKNPTNRTISFQYTITQPLPDGNQVTYSNRIAQLAAKRAIEVNTEKDIFPLLENAPLKISLLNVRFER
jgi:hypothetical protein